MKENITDDVKQIVDRTIAITGKNIVLATPLGLGKPTQILNEFYQRAKDDSEISLTIATALSLAKPRLTNELAKRLVNPILERLYKDHIELAYEVDRRNNNLPNNVTIIEFYFAPGIYLKNNQAQQDYIYCNYTHVVRDMLQLGINVVAQLIADEEQSDEYSFSSNCDLTMDLLQALQNISQSEKLPILLGEINDNLPFMYGDDALIEKSRFFAVLKK